MQEKMTLSLNVKNDNKMKKNGKKIKSSKALIEHLESVFKKNLNKNKEQISASLTKITKQNIVTLSKKEQLTSFELNGLLSMVKLSDPNFKVIADIATLAIERKSKMDETVRTSLMQFCTLAVSRYSILDSLRKDDVFKDFLKNGNEYLSQVDSELEDRYNKRIDGLKSIKNNKNKNGISNSVDSYEKDKRNLKLQRANVVTVGAIYGLFNNRIEHKDIIKYFLRTFYDYDSLDEVEVSLYLIKNRNNPEIKKSLFYFQQQLNSKTDEIKRFKEQLKTKSRDCSNFQEILAKEEENSKKSANDNHEKVLIIQNLNDKIKELSQEEKAKRVHLHDDSERAKSKAINLLEEDVLEPIKLCLSALSQDNPNADMVSDYLEIIEESIEKGLKWFKK